MESATAVLLARLKALSDLSRMRLAALCRQGECSVSELTGVLGLSQPRVSQHLRQLCEAGLLERFRDGQRVYYRVPGSVDALARALLDLLPLGDALLAGDLQGLRGLRGAALDCDRRAGAGREPPEAPDRAIHRAIIELTVAAPLGDLLDIGCGRGRLLKLLATRAHRAVGVDIDASARDVARAELMLAGLPNCTLRQGDMYRLPFGDGEFDTVILDDVLADAALPVAVLREASRVLRPGGRLFLLLSAAGRELQSLERSVAAWGSGAALRLSRARRVPAADPEWLLSVATPAERESAAA